MISSSEEANYVERSLNRQPDYQATTRRILE